MSQQIMGRAVKNLEPPRPLKSTIKQSHVPVYEVQSIEELITLTENVANSLSNGTSSSESMNALLSNLKLHGSQLENISKDTLDRAFVIFRNASQDERLNIMTRLNLLELIELRAKSWQISDGINSYYKSKATHVEPEMNDSTMLDTSPIGLSLVQLPSLSPGELIRTSGKFQKPTKIPGKNYSKDEIVIRNADSGKVMGIKGRRVHMIEELSETIISFQRVNPGAKERLVQITGPSEEKINYAKQLIEDTIRRNASPVRLDTSHDGSCSSLASSGSTEDMVQRVSTSNRNSLGGSNNTNAYEPNHQIMTGISNNYPSVAQYQNSKLSRSNSHNNGPQIGMLLHSFSSNDASLGEYKYTVNVGHHSIKITGDCFDLVRVAKLVLDDYFSSNDFLASYDVGSSYELSALNPTTPPSHHLNTSPFIDSGISVNLASRNSINDIEAEDDVFIVENVSTLAAKTENALTDNNCIVTSTPNLLSRSRRSHFSRKDSAPDGIRDSNTTDDNPARIVHEYERLIYFSKSPHSWALPRDWNKICEKHPHLVRNKVNSVNNQAFENGGGDFDYNISKNTNKHHQLRKTFSFDNNMSKFMNSYRNTQYLSQGLLSHHPSSISFNQQKSSPNNRLIRTKSSCD